MPHETYVVKFNETTDSYLTGWVGALEYENCSFGSLQNALEYESLEAAEEVALKINSGTVGLPRPRP